MTTEELVLKYWRSWQTPADFDEMEACLAPDVKMDLGMAQARSATEFRQIVESQPVPWNEVELKDSYFTDDAGIIIYEGVHSKTGHRTRVAELCRVANNQIVEVSSVLSTLPAV